MTHSFLNLFESAPTQIHRNVIVSRRSFGPGRLRAVVCHTDGEKAPEEGVYWVPMALRWVFRWIFVEHRSSEANLRRPFRAHSATRVARFQDCLRCSTPPRRSSCPLRHVSQPPPARSCSSLTRAARSTDHRGIPCPDEGCRVRRGQVDGRIRSLPKRRTRPVAA